MRFIGVDLAWGAVTNDEPNETALVALDPSGAICDAGWKRNLDEIVDWINQHSTHSTLLFVDAPLVVANPPGSQRLCEREVGQRYGRWKVSANSTNLSSPNLAGVTLRRRLTDKHEWKYSSGVEGPPKTGRWISECYPYVSVREWTA